MSGLSQKQTFESLDSENFCDVFSVLSQKRGVFRNLSQY